MLGNFTEKIFNISGFNIATKIWHPQNPKPILCLHGMLDNAASFDLLAPLLPDYKLVAIDFPGVGLSSHYPDGVLPHWKNDACLLLALIQALKWEQFDIIAHSLGSLTATMLAVVRPTQVRKIVFLDILGPKIKYTEDSIKYLKNNIQIYLNFQGQEKTIFNNQESAIQSRMTSGKISHQAASTLASRGLKPDQAGWSWAFDPRWLCVPSTLPHEDELITLFKAIESPVCLIRATQGISYPAKVFNTRAQAIKNLTIHEVPGGHHVHMDDPARVAEVINSFSL